MKYFGGIEGGGTKSHFVIMDENGQELASVIAPGTNHWIVGIPEVTKRINDMVIEGKRQAGIPQTMPLDSMGLALSGCEQEATNRDLEAAIRLAYPNISQTYFVCSDTIGSISTASANGGIVIIAGTGSNGLLRNPDGSQFTCGGWGHYIGDEGSAWRISYRAMKIVFDHMDGFRISQYPVDLVWQIIREVYNVDTRLDMLPHCYDKFNKTVFAGICKRLAVAAREGDELSKYVFHEAGQDLARIVQALLPNVHKDLVEDNTVKIVCVGGVWHSYDLLKEGLMQGLRSHSLLYDLSLVTITKPSAYGACYVGANAVQFPLPRNYSDNFEVMDTIRQHDIIISSMNGICDKNGIADY